MKTILLFLLLSLSGCVNTSKLVRELAKDQSTVRLRITTIYGMIELDRTSPRTNTLPHTIKDGTISVGQQ